jgi:hypothetical protein
MPRLGGGFRRWRREACMANNFRCEDLRMKRSLARTTVVVRLIDVACPQARR